MFSANGSSIEYICPPLLSIGTGRYYASDMGARRGGHGAIQSIISHTNNGCSLLSLILAKLLLLDINSKNVFALSIVTASGVTTGGGCYNLFLIEPQMTSYIIETVRTKCIIGVAFTNTHTRCIGYWQEH